MASASLMNELKSGNSSLQSVKELLDKGSNPDELFNTRYLPDRRCYEKKSPFMIACQKRQLDIIRLLLDRGANVDLQNEFGWSALMEAVSSKHVEVVQMLLEHGAKTDLRNNAHKTATLIACEQGLTEIVKIILPKDGLRRDHPYMFFAFKLACKHVEVVKLLLTDFKHEVAARALYFASENGYIEAMKILLEQKFDSPVINCFHDLEMQSSRNHDPEMQSLYHDINFFLNGEGSALMVASAHGRKEVVQLLLESDAEIDLQNKSRVSALMVAVKMLRYETVKLLLEKGANVNLKMKGGKTALLELVMYATPKTQEQVIELMKLLLENGADVNIEIDGRETALIYAMYLKFFMPAKLLLDKNARTDVLTRSGSPLQIAIIRGSTELAKLLLENGAPIDLQDSKGESALMTACKYERNEMTRLLVEKGAQVNLVDNEGRYALLEASSLLNLSSLDRLSNDQRNRLEVIEVLLKHGAKAGYFANDGQSALTALQFATSLQYQISKFAGKKLFFQLESEFPELVSLLRQAEGVEAEVEPNPEINTNAEVPSVQLSEGDEPPMSSVEAEVEPNPEINTNAEVPSVQLSEGDDAPMSSEADAPLEKIDNTTISDEEQETERKNADSENDDYVKQIEEAINENETISRNLAHGMFVGPTGAGKSSLMDRLLGRPRKEFSPSTGVSESVVVVDVDIGNPTTFHSVTVMEGNTWKEVEYDESLVRQMGKENITKTTQPAGASTSNEEVSMPTALTPSLPQGPPASQPSHTDAETKATPTATATVTTSSWTTPLREIVGKVIKKYGGYKNFKCFLKKTISLYLRDTGGQVEFQEMLPLLIFGPSIFFFVFRLDLDFKKKFRVEYRKGVGESLNCYTSSITTEEAFLQCLASVYAMDRPGNVKTHKPLVFIVGTHKDKLGPSADEKISDLNVHIFSSIKNNGFQDLVQCADRHKHQIMFTVDNTSDSDEDFKVIRSKVSSLIRNREEFTVEYPIRYLLFCLELQNLKHSVVYLSDCKIMAAKYGINGDDLVHLLQFLHLRIGVIRYFDKDGVGHIVIKEPQVLFNNATDLIVKTFSSDALTDGEADDFEKKGILTASVLATAVGNLDITPEIFLQLLVHLRIATPFTTPDDRDKEKKFFLPSVLNHVPESSEDDPKTDILPLAVKFKCEHCPKGLFGVLVTHLMTPDLNKGATSNTSNTTFTLMQDKIFKNQVSFEVHSPGVHDEMALKVHPSHLEIKFFPEHCEDRDTSITEVCDNVRQITERSIHQSLQDLHYSESRVDPVMCFRCEDCSELHPVEEGKKIVYHCKKTRTTRPIPPEGQWWYRKALTLDSAKRFLNHLPVEEVKNVGSHLGLRVLGISTVDEMLSKWLGKADYVSADSGTPSWEKLAEALKFNGYKDVALNLRKDVLSEGSGAF